MKSETALEWFQRCQRKYTTVQTATDPSSAARVFVSGNSGLAPIDMAWKLSTPTPNFATTNSSINNIDIDTAAVASVVSASTGTAAAVNDLHPLLVLEGNIGKTWMLLSLAARFVVSTRPSKFKNNTNENHNKNNKNNNQDEDKNGNDNHGNNNDDDDDPNNDNDNDSIHDLPQVILLDSSLDMTPCKLVQVVRSTLLRQIKDTTTLEQELEDCLKRIHIVTVDDDILGWLPVLEALRYKLKYYYNPHDNDNNNDDEDPTTSYSSSNNNNHDNSTFKKQEEPIILPSPLPHPTLVLWDGYSDNHHNASTEVTRQLLRLWDECSVAIVLAINVVTAFTTSNITSTLSSSSSAAVAVVGDAHANNNNNNRHYHHQQQLQQQNHNYHYNKAKFDWVRPPKSIHRIYLEQRSGKDCFAIVNGTKRPFSISSGGILS